MKRIILILTILLSGLSSMGNAPRGEGNELKKEIRKTVGYPDFAKADKLRGVVLVKFRVDEEGVISVMEINASDEHLGEYVTKKLESIHVEDRNAEGEHFARFNFRFVDF